MFTARQGKEIMVEVVNEIGVLHNLTRTVAEKGVNILAVSGNVHGRNAIVRLVTDDNLRAVEALRARNYKPLEIDVVLAELPHKPGMLERLTARLGRGGVDIAHIAATAPLNQDKALVVLVCADPDRAMVLLNAP
jgi:hypothetical protein